ncbi:MAG: membrane dipeptidase [Planctomycetes bacterium]|nr:membrane dipeptidase [Planctomycetota bacterium]
MVSRTPAGWFDAHLDLAYLAECGRDMAAPLDPSTQPHPPAAVTFPSLASGRIETCLGTIFTEAIDPGSDAKYATIAYPAGDADAAHRAGCRQLDRYARWRAEGLIRLFNDEQSDRPALPIALGVLIECADPIRVPDELSWWVERGVVAVGMAWWKSSRYAGGNGTDGPLTAMGRELAQAMDELGVVHDLSHLSQRATDQLLAATDKPVIASHSNCRALIDGDNQRHLTDETIAEIGRRGGVIGLNLCSPFLVQAGDAGGPASGTRATIDDCARHVEHICAIQGDRRGVGLGSDMDGGFSADRLPVGITTPSDLNLIPDALKERGWTEDELRGFRFDNWSRFFGLR